MGGRGKEKVGKEVSVICFSSYFFVYITPFGPAGKHTYYGENDMFISSMEIREALELTHTVVCMYGRVGVRQTSYTPVSYEYIFR